MTKINLPSSILEKESYGMLPSLQKEEYITNLLKEILRLNPSGITISQVTKNIYLSHSVVWHHLEVMASRGECLRIEHGDVDVYFYNTVINSLNEFDFSCNISDFEFKYNFDIVENIFGKFVRIQRQRESRTRTHYTRAGILIPHSLVGKITDVLLKIKEDHLNEKF